MSGSINNDHNPDVTAKFESNIFSVTRQVYFSSVDHKSVDMVVFLNGLPLATLELIESLISQAVNKQRKKDLDLYKVYAGDPDFKKAFDESIIRILALHEKSKPG